MEWNEILRCKMKQNVREQNKIKQRNSHKLELELWKEYEERNKYKNNHDDDRNIQSKWNTFFDEKTKWKYIL